MMLRSSSTPILGSLLSSYSESPNHNHHSEFNSPKHLPRKLSIHQTAPLNLITPSTHSFNSSPSINAEFGGAYNSCTNGLRRVQSDGNLGQLAIGSCNGFDEFSHQISNKKFPRKPNCSVLQTIPSFSVHRRRTGNKEDYYDEEDDEEEADEEEEKIGKVEYEDISLNKGMEYNMNSNQWSENRNFVVEPQNEGIISKMHLAKGLGTITDGFTGGGGRNDYRFTGFGGDGSDGAGMEEYYQRMMVENPGNSLFLRNYAQFLHQSKKDLGGAEEYYSRAILVDPGDGEILSQYAQLTWELHRDEERASNYFQQAVQAAPEDCHVLAAYAGFLWETEEGNDNDMLCTQIPLDQKSTAAVAAVTT